MPEVWKEIIRPSSYVYIDEQTGKPRTLTVTPEKVKHYHDAGLRMLEAGLSIPIPLEHQRECAPQTPAERAANNLLHNAGFVKDYRVLPGDRLFGLCDIADPELAARLPATVRYTSPWINSFTDGNGTRWEEVISHLALTSRPRITKQAPFGSVEAALSLAGMESSPSSIPAPLPPGGLFLSRAGRLKSNHTPFFPAACSVYLGIKLAEDYDDEAAPAKKKPPMMGTKSPDLDVPPPDPAATDPAMDMDSLDNTLPGEEMKEMGLVDVLRDVMSALFDIELPETTDEKTLLNDLLRATMDHLKMTKGGDMPKPDEDTTMPDKPANTTSAAPITQEQPPLYMSLEEIRTITDPDKKRLAEALLSLQGQVAAGKKQAEALAKNAMEDARRRRAARIRRLCERIPAANAASFRQQLEAQAAGAMLSLSDDGTVHDPLSATLDLLDGAIVQMPALLLHPGEPSAQPHPEEFDGTLNEERRQAIVEELSRNSGIPAPKTKAS